jgi:hypothetical protein
MTMTRMIHAAAFSVALFAASLTASLAQPMSTPTDRVLRPGDKIRWVPDPQSPHKLQLGSTGLTSLADVDKILTISPAPTTDSNGVRIWKPGQAVTGTVNDNADTAGVANFIFTCGAHPAKMKSEPFTFEAKPANQGERTFNIRSDPAIKWIMQKPDGGGEVQVSVP